MFLNMLVSFSPQLSPCSSSAIDNEAHIVGESHATGVFLNMLVSFTPGASTRPSSAMDHEGHPWENYVLLCHIGCKREAVSGNIINEDDQDHVDTGGHIWTIKD